MMVLVFAAAGLLLLAAFVALWLFDARHARREMRDPQRLDPEPTRRRRRFFDRHR